MRYDQFTIKAQGIVQRAHNLAVQTQSPEISPEHLLEALVAQEDGVTQPILQKLGADIEGIRLKLTQALERNPKVQGTGQEPVVSQTLKRIFDLALKEATYLRDEYLSTELLLQIIVFLELEIFWLMCFQILIKKNPNKILFYLSTY